MASPQVCGVGALLLQANPHSTPAQLKSHLIATCQTNGIYSTGLDNDYGVSRSIKGGNNRFLVKLYEREKFHGLDLVSFLKIYNERK